MLIVPATIFILHFMGRPWQCSCDQAGIWKGNVLSMHCSQHLFDPYSFTHILHGFMFCGITAFFLSRLSHAWRFNIAVLMESGWELLENSQYVITRYRTATFSLGYSGDSILNSTGDILSCSLGFWIAYYLGFKKGILFFLLTEIFLLFFIRDCLLLNIIMLLFPVDSIRAWQMAL